MPARLRDVLLFVGGGAVMIHQVAFVASPSPTLIGASLAMMIGAPAVYRLLDSWTGRNRDGTP